MVSSITDKPNKSSSKTNNQVTLNSYKPVLTTDSLSSTTTSLNTQCIDSYSNDSGINSLNLSSSAYQQSLSKKNNWQYLNNKNGYDGIMNNNYNICPKLDEVQIIEPLICKRIAKERLTSLVFKKDCFIVATLDGYLNTWARPSKVINFVVAPEFIKHFLLHCF